MIRRIQALNFRCLRYLDLRLDRFHLLVGPNASGKSTLFDAVAFLGDLVRDGLEPAIGGRTANFQDLVWRRPGGEMGFELAVEADIPPEVAERLPPEMGFEVVRYEIAIREDGDGLGISSERALLMPRPKEPQPPRQTSLFPDPPAPPESILLGRGRAGMRSVLSKTDRGTDSYYVETAVKAGKGWVTTIAFGPRRSTLASLPESQDKFPASTFLKRKLAHGVRRLFLDIRTMRRPSPPQFGAEGLADDGSNLPWAVRRLHEQHPAAYREWLERVRAVLPGLADLRVVERPEDRRAYLALRYDTGVEVPSWTASGGTMRVLALTLLGHLPKSNDGGIILIEEPESGVHPPALHAVRDSLRSAHRVQVLATTYSPVLLALVDPSEVLCFGRDEDGATDVVRGDEHPVPGGCGSSPEPAPAPRPG